MVTKVVTRVATDLVEAHTDEDDPKREGDAEGVHATSPSHQGHQEGHGHLEDQTTRPRDQEVQAGEEGQDQLADPRPRPTRSTENIGKKRRSTLQERESGQPQDLTGVNC